MRQTSTFQTQDAATTDQGVPVAQAVAARRALRGSARTTLLLQGRQAVNIMRTVTSTLGSIRRLALLGATFTLAACGSSQNWKDKSEYVTVGGTVSGFTGGGLTLWNNGKDRLPIALFATYDPNS